MSALPYSDSELAESATAFAEKITPAKERWRYCADRSTYIFPSKRYGTGPVLNLRTVKVCARILGTNEYSARLRLGRIMRDGIDEAWAWAEDWDKKPHRKNWPATFAVGPMQAWHVGHLYFARCVAHPHVVKIGFSRRVRARLDDIESKAKTKIELHPGEIRVGTLADEHWWHKNWEKYRIAGEWFFDPHMPERTLPGFLVERDQAEAA